MHFRNLLIRQLAALSRAFDRDELAYLALTCKIEFPIRDKLAYQLHRQLAPKGLSVAREWRRTDLAVLRDFAPLMLLEIKALYSFDVANRKYGAREWAGRLSRDLRKARNVGDGTPEIYGLLLLTHPARAFGPPFDGVVKYRSGIDRAFSDRGDARAIEQRAQGLLRQPLSHLRLLKQGRLAAGAAFGVSTSVLYSLFGPAA